LNANSAAGVPVIAAVSMAYNQALTAALGVFLASALGAETYGIVNLARNLFAIALVLSPLGLDIGLQRYFAEDGRPRDAARIMFWLRAAAAVLACSVVAAAYWASGWLETSVFRHPGAGAIIVATMAGLPFATDMAVLGGAYRGLGSPSRSLIATYVAQPTCRALLIPPLLRVLPGAPAVALGTSGAYFTAWAALAWRARTAIPATPASPRGVRRPLTQVLGYSSVMGLSTFVFTLARSLDTLALGRWASLGEVGRYAVAQMAGLLAGMIGASLGQTLAARVATEARRDNRERVVSLLRRNLMLSSMLASPPLAAVAAWGPDIAPLIGKSYQTPGAVYVLVALTQWVVTVTHNSSAALTMTGRHALELRNNVLALAVQSLACVALVPRWGATGAAAATLLMMLSINGARQWQIAAALGRGIATARLLLPLAIAALVAAPLVAARDRLGFRAWWLTGAACAVELLVSYAILAIAMPDARRLSRRADEGSEPRGRAGS
jgi:O-antigen/teichoic acid export membrane protein